MSDFHCLCPQIVAESGSPDKRRDAQRIMPIRKRGNLLLCTLLLGNVAVNSALSILMADVTSGLVGFFTSTIVIVIFGEILPQATCSRFPLCEWARSMRQRGGADASCPGPRWAAGALWC